MVESIFLLAIVFLAILETTLLSFFRVFGVVPNLLLASVVVAGFSFGPRWTLFFAICAGILKDIFSLSTFGINTVLFPLWGLLVIKITKNLVIENNLIYAILLFIIVVLNDIASRLILLYCGSFLPLSTTLRIIALDAIYTALAVPLLFKLNRFLFSYKK